MTQTWQISSRKEWVVIESGPDVAWLVGEEIEGFGTYAGGFWVANGQGPVQFKAETDHASQCVDQIADLLAGPIPSRTGA